MIIPYPDSNRVDFHAKWQWKSPSNAPLTRQWSLQVTYIDEYSIANIKPLDQSLKLDLQPKFSERQLK